MEQLLSISELISSSLKLQYSKKNKNISTHSICMKISNKSGSPKLPNIVFAHNLANEVNK